MINRYLDEFIKNRIPLFLLPPHRKDPIPGSRGFKDWTRDEKIIRSWKTENIGIPTGDISGIFVYDTDIKTGENGNIGINGLYGFLKILKLNTLDDYLKKYPDALIVQTGSGGYHIYFGIPPGLDHNLSIATNINGIKGLDVRGNGGYVVAPGSIHPNGNEYKIIHGSLAQIPFMPDELYNFWYSHDHPEAFSDDFNEAKMPLNLDDKILNLDIETTAMIFKKTPVNEGNNLLMAHAGAHALRGVSIENEKLILKEAAALNHWNGKINFSTVNDSYKRVEMQKYGRIPEKEKSKTLVKGYTTLKRIITENKENYPDYDKILKNLNEIFESRQVDGNIEFKINDGKYIGYDLADKYFYYFYPHAKIKMLSIYSIPIKFIGLAIDDEGNHFYHMALINKLDYYTIDNIKDVLRTYAITGSTMASIMQFFLLYSNDLNNIKNAEHIHPDHIYLENGVIKYDDSYKHIDSHQSLELLHQLSLVASSGQNFIINLAYMTAAPLSYFIRRDYGKLFPVLINAGFAQSGKTTYLKLLVNKGYDNENAHFGENDVKTQYTTMLAISNSILPIRLEDVELDWFRKLSTELKGTSYSTKAGSRGHIHGIDVYQAKSAISIDTNEAIDTQIAQLDRFIVCNFTASDRNRINIKNFEAIEGRLEYGFMFEIFNAIFGNKKLSDVVHDIYSVKNRQEAKISLLKYVINNINTLMPPDMHFPMPDFSLLNNESNITDWPSELYNICTYAYSQINNEYRNAPYGLNLNILDVVDNKVYLTALGYNSIQRYLNLPYKNIHAFLSNVQSTDFSCDIISHRFNEDETKYQNKTYPVRSLLIEHIEKIPDLKIPNPPKEGTENGKNGKNKNNGNETNNSSNSDIDDLPEGPVKQSLIEEKELKELEKQNPGYSQEKQEIQKPLKTNSSNNKKSIHYYQLNANFDKYGYDFFNGSDIELQSSRTYYYKDSTRIKYMLYQLLMPEEPENTPVRWFSFINKDGRELKSEKEYNALSKGDL